MSEELNFEGVMSSNWKDLELTECADGITMGVLWEGENGKRAEVYEFSPGAVFPGLDVHESGPEQVYVISGVFSDGREDFPAGSFIHHPMGSSHAPQSAPGCVLLVLFPEG